MPLVSVIIPTYNRRHLISRAISSVLNQTFKDFEIVIIDDNSSDDTDKLINALSDNRIIYFKHDVNRGPAAARNTGIKNSTGEFIAFLDSDDEWLPTKLEKQIDEFLQLNAEYGLVYVSSLIKKNEKLMPYLPFKWLKKVEGDLFDQLLMINFIGTPSVMIKREVFDEIGFFDESLQCVEDYDLFLRISRKYKIKLISENLLIINPSNDGINMKSVELHASVLNKITQKYIPFYNNDLHLYSDRLMIIGDLYYKAGNKESAKEYFNLALDKFGYNLKCRVLLFFANLSIKTGLESYNFARLWVIRLNRILTGKGGLY